MTPSKSSKSRKAGTPLSRPARSKSGRRGSPRAASVLRELFSRTRTAEFERFLKGLLVELCRIDTTPKPDPAQMRIAEDQCFRILERELGLLGFGGARLERRPIDPAIQAHPHFSLLHFTKTSQRPAGLSPEATYAGRSNLVYLIPATESGGAGQSVALNAHIDVVAPYFPPRVKDGIVYGRGACDDKGPAVAVVAALKALSEVMPKSGLNWRRNVAAMFVTEEETGGNGSLSLAIDRDLRKLYDSVVVSECTGLKFYPANRGAVWYRAELKPVQGGSLLELAACVLEEMEKEGAAIRAESRHPLFPQRPVQTCHGIVGPFGEHPSRICGEVSFVVRFGRRANATCEALVRDCLEAGLAEYIGLYGDKTKVLDASTGKPMVARHCDLRRVPGGFQVDVHGAAGHMGAIRERDGAITKAAHLVLSLMRSRARLQAAAGANFSLQLAGQPDGETLVLEGGQGFVPTHDITEVMQRLRQAAERGAAYYLRRLGRPESGEQATGVVPKSASAIFPEGRAPASPKLRPVAEQNRGLAGARPSGDPFGQHAVVTVTYGKLHNVAFDGNPNSPSMRNAIAAARTCGVWKDEPVLGWTVSCDARLFASEYPGLDVLTFGPGQLAFAHSDQEQISLEEIRAAAECLAVFLLRQTGTL